MSTRAFSSLAAITQMGNRQNLPVSQIILKISPKPHWGTAPLPLGLSIDAKATTTKHHIVVLE